MLVRPLTRFSNRSAHGRLNLGGNYRLTDSSWLLWAVDEKGVDWAVLKALVPEAALQAAQQLEQAGQPQGQAQQLEQAGQPQGPAQQQGPEPWMTVDLLRRMIDSIKNNMRQVTRRSAWQQEGQQQPQQGDGAKQTQRVTRSSAQQQEGQQQPQQGDGAKQTRRVTRSSARQQEGQQQQEDKQQK